MPTTTVVNLRSEFFDVYVGRVNGSSEHFGNPFSYLPNSLALVKVPSRDAAVSAFTQWLAGVSRYKDVEPGRRLWILANLHTLKGKRLGCFCKPLDCHGDVLARLADAAAT